MSDEEFGYDEESFYFDDGYFIEDEPTPRDKELGKAEWACAKCHRTFTDPEDLAVKEGLNNLEPRLYWLSITEPICSECAIEAGIPPVDEG